MNLDELKRRLPNPGSSAAWIRKGWDLLSPLPGGRQLYAKLLSATIPYTGSVRAEIVELQPGYAMVRMADRRALRNHLGSVHAIALCNLAELTGNIALAYALPDDARFIVTELRIQYLKKARGTITANCHCPPEFSNERKEYVLNIDLIDPDDQIVAKAQLTTLVGPTKQTASS
jgi:uncharacterized protein (TIGR00369 family)